MTTHQDESNMAAGFGAALEITEQIVDEMVCRWSEDGDGIWNTGCGNAFEMSADGPKDNEMRYCCYCGKPIEEFRYGEEGENDE